MAYQITKPKGKTEYSKSIATRIEQASQFPTLAEMLAAAGLGGYAPGFENTGNVDNRAVDYILQDLADQSYILADTANGLHMALYGLPDKPIVPPEAWGFVAASGVVFPPAAILALVQVLRSSKPNIQDVVGTSKSLQDMLDELAMTDYAAADMLANQIRANQAEYGSEYTDRMVAAFKKGAWYGAAQAVKVPVEVAAQAVGTAVGSIVTGVTGGLGFWGWAAAIGAAGYAAHRAGVFKRFREKRS